MKDFLSYFVLPLVTTLFGLWFGVYVHSDIIEAKRQVMKDCNEHLEITNAPRKMKCVVEVVAKVVEE